MEPHSHPYKLPVRALVLGLVALLLGACGVSWRGVFKTTRGSSLAVVATTDKPETLQIANLFVTGKRKADDNEAHPSRLHTPSWWSRTWPLRKALPRWPLQRALSEQRQGYFLRDLRLGGQDAHPTYGIEGATLFLLVAHGQTSGWKLNEGKFLNLSETSVGDFSARYFWQLSCNVMAHGPPAQRGTEYERPSEFDPNWSQQGPVPSSLDHANVWFRWAKEYDHGTAKVTPLNPNIRQVCGGSTTIGGDTNPTEPIWRHLLIDRLPPAEAFLLGTVVTATRPTIPLCLARGAAPSEQAPGLSPLQDSRFRTAKNPARKIAESDRHVYIEYPDLTPSQDTHHPAEVPNQLPILQLETPVDPLAGLKSLSLQGFGFRSTTLKDLQRTRAQAELSLEAQALAALGLEEPEINPADVCVDSNAEAGFLVISYRPSSVPQNWDAELGERVFTNLKDLVGDPSLLSQSALSDLIRDRQVEVEASLVDIPLILDSRAEPCAANAECKDIINRFKACKFTQARYDYRVGEISYKDLGTRTGLAGVCPSWRLEGELQAPSKHACRRRTPPLFILSVPTRQEATIRRQVASLGIETAKLQAEHRLQQVTGAAANWQQSSKPTLGFRSASVHCAQKMLVPIYQFRFEEQNPGPGRAPVTQVIEVHAVDACRDKSVEECFQTLGGKSACSLE
jgi:hypothetical protein